MILVINQLHLSMDIHVQSKLCNKHILAYILRIYLTLMSVLCWNGCSWYFEAKNSDFTSKFCLQLTEGVMTIFTNQADWHEYQYILVSLLQYSCFWVSTDKTCLRTRLFVSYMFVCSGHLNTFYINLVVMTACITHTNITCFCYCLLWKKGVYGQDNFFASFYMAHIEWKFWTGVSIHMFVTIQFH